MSRLQNYNHTVRAASIGYIVQSMINTFAPLLFVTFQTQYTITLAQVSILIAANFGSQIVLDFLAAGWADRIGYRPCVLAAHGLAAIGIGGLALFPSVFSNPFHGLLLAVIIYGAGGGLTEVLLSPIVQACPIEHKDKAISMLHSFYCWGSVIVIVLSTIYFRVAGIENWKLLALLWMILPIANGIYFAFVPMYQLLPEGEKMSSKELAKSGIFWLLLIFMFCAGACEMAIAQWASDFCEKGLHVSKGIGDLLGPCLFGLLKGVERAWYGKRGKLSNLWKFMMGCAVVCGLCYFVLGISSSAVIGLIACAIAGFATGVMWPGTFTLADRHLPMGGTALFGMLALAGDVGCGAGPAITGFISSHFGDNLQIGFLYGTVFSLIMIVGLLVLLKRERKTVS